jgi:nucleotide-binding universal stress UspA family protein
MIKYKNILFCTDFSEDANIAFVHAMDLARRYKSRLHILHIPDASYSYRKHGVNEHVPKDVESGETFLDEDMEKFATATLEEAYEKKLTDFDDYIFVVRRGSPDVEIIRYAKKNEIDVIVMGALGQSELDRIVHGSTISNVSRYAHCHVVAIRNPAKQFILPGKMV